MEPAELPLSEPIVLVVEDDDSVRRSLQSLLRSAGYQSIAYVSVPEFLDATLPDTLRCLVTDVRLPKVSGLELPAELDRRGLAIPTIFVTAHGDIPMTVRAMKAGAVDFLPKPFRDQDLLDAVAAALEKDKGRREEEQGLVRLRAGFESLTPREREVMRLVATGLLNKQVAGELGLSEITVKLHRASVMRKMGVRSLAELVRAVDALTRAGIGG